MAAPPPLAEPAHAATGASLRVLGLDMSSTCIGWAVLDGGVLVAGGYEDLAGDIAARCRRAAAYVGGLYAHHRPALVIIESPVARFAKAVIPQARVSGAVLARLSAVEALWCEVRPQDAKVALCNDASATKAEMVEAAAELIGLRGTVGKRNGKVRLVRADGYVLLTEDEADAIGLALAGRAVKVERVAA